MKSLITVIVVVFAFSFCAASCSKDDAETRSKTMKMW